LSRLSRKDGRKKSSSERVGRILGDFGEFAPGNESRRELFAIECRAQQMPLEHEVLPDRPEAREKFLYAFSIAKAAHATLAFARWLVAVLGAVVQSGGRFDEHVLHFCRLRDLRFCRRIAAQLIGDDLARGRVRNFVC
jgi:hypothetical protein